MFPILDIFSELQLIDEIVIFEGWVPKSRGLGGKVQRVGWQSLEGFLCGKSRGLGGKV